MNSDTNTHSRPAYKTLKGISKAVRVTEPTLRKFVRLGVVIPDATLDGREIFLKDNLPAIKRAVVANRWRRNYHA